MSGDDFDDFGGGLPDMEPPEPIIRDFKPEDPAVELIWDDAGLHKIYYDDDLDLKRDDDMFFTPADSTDANHSGTKKPESTSNALASHEFEEAAITAAGGLGLMIPEVGPVIFAASIGATFLLHEYDKSEKAAGSVNGKNRDKILLLEKDLFELVKKQRLSKYKGTLEALKNGIAHRADKEEKVFERTGADDYQLVDEVYQTLKTHAFGANADSSLPSMVNTLMNDYKWGDGDLQQVLINMIPFMVQCMELKLVLDANLSSICAKRTDEKKGQAEGWRVQFDADLSYVAATLRDDVVKKLRGWIKDKKEERLKGWNDKKTVVYERKEESGLFNGWIETWQFGDGYSGRVFKVTIKQGEMNNGACYPEDVRKKMKKYMEDMAKWYGDKLQEHVNHHFDVLEKTVGEWEKVATELNKYWQTSPGTGKHRQELDGAKMFKQMIRLEQRSHLT